MVNKTHAAATAGRHDTSGRRRRIRMQGSPRVLVAVVAAILMTVAALTPSSGWAAGRTVVSSGGSTPAGGGAADGGSDAGAVVCTPATQPRAGGGATGGCTADAAILVTLSWNNNNDEDLHVVEPDGTEIAYYAPGPTATGGMLDRDDEVGMCETEDGTTGAENVTWAAWTHPAPGSYRVRVIEFNPCSAGVPAPAEWNLQIRIEGRVVQNHAGTTPGTTPRDTVAEFTFEYPADQQDQAASDVT